MRQQVVAVEVKKQTCGGNPLRLDTEQELPVKHK